MTTDVIYVKIQDCDSFLYDSSYKTKLILKSRSKIQFEFLIHSFTLCGI